MPFSDKRTKATLIKEREQLVNDLTNLRATVVALLAKLDGDELGGKDYVATITVADLESTV